jgi:hypothetical protein
MANIFRTSQYVLDDVFVRFWNSLAFARTANRNLEGDFKSLRFATGATINYRLEERYLGGEGATAAPEARVQITRPLSITKQFHQMIDYTGFNLTFDRARDEPYLEMANAPRAKRLANMVENFIARENFYPATYQAIGTPGVPIDTNTIFQTDAYMTELAIPEDGKRYCGIAPRVAANLSNDLYNVFNNTVNTGALIDGFVGHLSGFDFFKTNFLGRHIAGLGENGPAPETGFLLGGVVTNGPISSGSTITVNTLGRNPFDVVFNKGDIIEVSEADGVFMVNPLTQQPLAQRAQFVVTAQVVTPDGINATIPVSPEIIVSGARQNISAPIPNGAQLLLRASHNVSLAYHTQALVFAAPALKELRGGVEAVTTYSDLYKLALTYSLGADVRNYEQLDRVDVICGVAINPEFAVRICS